MELERIDTQKAYNLIKEKIITLQLKPGAPIDEDALCAEAGLTPTAVREALKWLAHDHLVDITPRHGIRVAEANPAELRELFEMRLPLETLCARMAAERATADDIVVMDALVREYERVKGAGNVDTLLDLDHRFHSALADAAHNRYMRETLERFFGLSERLWYLASPQIDWVLSALDRHAELVQAIKARDAERAAGLMHQHVLDFQALVERALGLG
ncbi:MAG: GntR family transcriptional regulator [Anaerolineae bacterium]|nr:GntR family transcriptional regulator [Anaerolineae bacterium]